MAERPTISGKTWSYLGLIHYSTDIRGISCTNYPICVNNKTYIPFGDKNGDTWIAVHDNVTPAPIIPYKVATRSDYGGGVDIDHNFPACCLDSNGYIYVFYGCHNTQLYCRKSIFPYSPVKWGPRLTVTGASTATYPLPFLMADGTIRIIYRQNPTIGTCIVSTADAGATWINNTVLNATTTSYLPYHYGFALGTEVTPSIHLAINYRLSAAQPSDPFGVTYYMKSLDGGATWKKADGTTYTLPGDETSLEQIATTGSYPGSMKLDSNNRPYLAYLDNSTKVIKFIRYNGSAWTSVVNVCAVTTFQFEGLEMDVISDSIIDIYAIAGTAGNINGGNIQRYRSTDTGATWALAENITTDAVSGTYGYRYYHPSLVRNYNSNLKLIYNAGVPSDNYDSSRFSFRSYP